MANPYNTTLFKCTAVAYGMAVTVGKGEPGVMEAWLEGEGAGVGAGTLLHAATRGGKVEVVRTLLERRTVVVDLRDEEGDTALHVAARCTLRLLLTLLLPPPSGAASTRSCSCSWLLARTLAYQTWQGRRPWPSWATCQQTSPRWVLNCITPPHPCTPRHPTPHLLLILILHLPFLLLLPFFLLLLLTQEILDSCILAERQGNTLSVTLTYPFLSPPQQPREVDSEKGEGSKEEMVMTKTKAEETKEEPAKSLPETNSLLFMIESAEHDHLLEHPIVNSFLRLKFASIAPWYIFKTLCYAVLIAFINAYVYLLNRHIMEEGVPEETSAELGVKWMTILMLVALGGRVLIYLVKVVPNVVRKIVAGLSKLKMNQQDQHNQHVQKKARPLENLTNIEEWLLVGILLSSSLLISLPWEVERVRHLSATTVLTTWFGFLFHIGFHPSFGLYRNMFITVSKNFLRFLTWFLLFIIAFALSFFFLFAMPGTDENPAFASAKQSLEKTIVMAFLGEIDYGDLVFTHEFGKFIFVLFIFFVMLVIMNLLNGLAISDIGVIQQESAMNTQKIRMNYIVAYEDILINFPAFLRNLGGFKLLGDLVTNRAARFQQKGKNWTCEDVEMPADVLDLVKVHIQNKALADAEEKAKKADEEEGPAIKEVQERLRRIERVLENLTENIAKLK